MNDAATAITPTTRRRRTGVALRFGLAGLALLGIGAAATSANWTNDAWFNGASSSASVLLDGSATSATGPWTAADTDATGITFAGSTFSLLVPGQTRTATYWVRNSSTSCLNVPAPVVTKAEPLAGTNALTDATVALTPSVLGNLAPGTVQAVTVTVTTPTGWATSHQNQTSASALKIAYTGSTVVASTSAGACA